MIKYVQKYCVDCGADLGIVVSNRRFCQDCADRHIRETQRATQENLRKMAAMQQVRSAHRTAWTEEEDAYIIDHYVPHRYTTRQLSRDLKRTFNSVTIRIHRLREEGKIK